VCNGAGAVGFGWAEGFGLSQYSGVLVLRFATGFFLAGVYPVGMKLAADWFSDGLGRALGYLVGALVLGTALPHLVRATVGDLPWQSVLVATSLLAAAGGVAVFLGVPDGPHRRRGGSFRPLAIIAALKGSRFRSAALGYFGHMWELYTFWAFVPVVLASRLSSAGQSPDATTVSALSFGVIAAGALGCVGGGYIAVRSGSAAVAVAALAVSGVLCLLSPLVMMAPLALFITLLAVWGVAVITDSPQFSTLIAGNAPPEFRGSALTIVNCIGFAITIPSIQMLSSFATRVAPEWLLVVLAIGPILGLVAMKPLVGAAAVARDPLPPTSS
jgi:MFS family permease